jgi:AraC family transcriptional regulator of adaptative response / DNA-3-methyladenine glycosylase II
VKPAKSRNVVFFPTAAAAERAGFRPCLRCRPETAPGTPSWHGAAATVTRALRLIERGFLDDRKRVEDLADTLGITTRHLRRLFVRHAGASPTAVVTTPARSARETADGRDRDADVVDRVRFGVRERPAIQRRVSRRVSTAANRRSQKKPSAWGARNGASP